MNRTEGRDGWERTRCLMSGPAGEPARSENAGVTEGIGSFGAGRRRRARCYLGRGGIKAGLESKWGS